MAVGTLTLARRRGGLAEEFLTVAGGWGAAAGQVSAAVLQCRGCAAVSVTSAPLNRGGSLAAARGPLLLLPRSQL